MGAVTYPNAKVIDFLQNEVISVQLPFNAKPEASDYGVKWTPLLLVLDAEGRQHHRILGFLPPVEFIPSMLLGMGKALFGNDRFDEAVPIFDRVCSEFSYSCSAPEAVYFRGVTRYKSTHKAESLKDAYQMLQVHHHSSEWSQRAYPYWLLP